MNKSALRKQARQKREGFATKHGEAASKEICQKIEQELDLTNKILAIYYPINNEVNLLSLATGKYKTALPVITDETRKMRFYSWQQGKNLVEGKFNIPHPSADSSQVQPDIVFFPLIAFDKQMHRLGYGGGYYDATIAGLKKPVLKVGVAYACQEIERIPAEEHDIKLDIIITENKVIKA